MPAPTWVIDWEDVVDGKLITSAEDSFTSIFIIYTDSDTGEERVANAMASDASEGFMLLERAVRVKEPMPADEAQALADRAVAVGHLGRHGFLTLRLEQQLERGSDSRPASEISEGDTVQLRDHGDQLHVFGVTRDSETGTVLLTLGAEHHRERLDLELTFLRLERGA
ncbi:MAG TPA: hypothetical protein VF529_09610 [Solirubrobacteraceae bacterium]|jgi:hypothetical protein